MTEAHDIRFRTLDAMAPIEREVSSLLGFGPSRALTADQEEIMHATAEAAVEAWADIKHQEPDIEAQTPLDRLCAEFLALHEAETASRSHNGPFSV